MAEAMPEQNTKISVASEKPKRAGIQLLKKLFGVCATRMMNIASPRKKSSRRSRVPAAGAAVRAEARGILGSAMLVMAGSGPR